MAGKNMNNAQAQAKFREGLLLHQQGQLEPAQELYQKVLGLQANHFDALHLSGVIAGQRKNFAQAIVLIRQALALNSHSSTAHYNLGSALAELKMYEEALLSYRQAIALDDNYAEAHGSRGDVYLELNEHAKAVQSYELLVEKAPRANFAKGKLLYAKLLACDWAGLDKLSAALASDVRAGLKSAKPFSYQAISNSPQDLHACAQIYSHEVAPPQPPVFHHRPTPRANKIRIGYLSGEFRSQATSILMTGLFESHDRNRFEVHGFDNGWDDGSHAILLAPTLPDEDVARLEPETSSEALKTQLATGIPGTDTLGNPASLL